MAIVTEVVAQKTLAISTGTPVAHTFPMFAASDIMVYYGVVAPALAVQNVDYTYVLAVDFQSFTITPTASLIAKIDALILSDPTNEINYMTVRRDMGNLTTTTPADVRQTKFASTEFDRTALRFQQIQDNLNRALTLSPNFVGDTPKMELTEAKADTSLVFNATASAIITGPTASEISSAQGYAVAALASKDAAGVSEANAASSEAKAQDWAEEVEDTPVEAGKFSALHHAAKAAASAAALPIVYDTIAEFKASTEAARSVGSVVDYGHHKGVVVAAGGDIQNSAGVPMQLDVLVNESGDYSVDAFDGNVVSAINAADAIDTFAVLSDGKAYSSAGGVINGNIRLKGQGAVTFTGVIQLPNGAEEVHLDGPVFINAGLLHSSGNTPLTKVRIFNTNVSGAHGYHLNSGAADVVIAHNDFHNLTAVSSSCQAVRIGSNIYADSLVSNFIRIYGNKVDGVSNSSSSETHAFLIYGYDIAIFGNTINDVYHSAESACEAIYAKGVRVSITGNTILDCGPSNDGCINVKGADYGDTSASQGHECTVSGNTISYTKNKTTNVIGISAVIPNALVVGNNLYNTYIRVFSTIADNVAILSNNIRLDTETVPIAMDVTDGDEVSIIGNKVSVVTNSFTSTTSDVIRIRALNDSVIVIESNHFEVVHNSLITVIRAGCINLWTDTADLDVTIKNNIFRMDGALIANLTRLNPIYLSGSNTAKGVVQGNVYNHNNLFAVASGTSNLEFYFNRVERYELTTGNAGLGDTWDDRVFNVGATAVRVVYPSTAPKKGMKVEIICDSQSYNMAVSISPATWHDGTSANKTLTQGSRVMLECRIDGVWTETEVAGSFT